MSTHRVYVARCVRRGDDWELTVAGTDVREVVPSTHRWLAGPLAKFPDEFPGNGMGNVLATLGWVPDRRAMYGMDSMSPVQRALALVLQGWTRKGVNEWTIPCYAGSDVVPLRPQGGAAR